MFLYTFDPGYVLRVLPALASGLRLTLAVSAIGIAGSLLIGVAGGAVRAARLPVLDAAVAVYVEVFRNTPLIVQLFFLYFGLPEVNVRLSAFTVGWLGLALWGGAYHVENLRAGFESVAHRYRESAQALGMDARVAFLTVVLPVGARVVIPSVANTCISTLKNSSYLIAISLPELTTTAINIVSLSFRVFEMFGAIAVIYLVLVWSISGAAATIERRFALPEGI
ncbi:MAG: amino acid ABC transporter permease [Chloroflexi bacterium]|nr:MAG: amino acid ABC transporter permease [Chloroflexota bacterium]